MLRDTFFSVVRESSAAGVIKASLSVNKDHAVFSGHFPGLPVVPGVCMIQMIKELMEAQTHLSLRVKEAGNIKFLSVIDPRQHPEIEASIVYTSENGSFIVNASLFAGDVTFFKLKATLQNAE